MSSDLTRECPGLPAEWINGWLAAVGITVLDPEIRLSWTSDPSPIAVLHHPDKEPGVAAAEAWPSRSRLEEMPLDVDRDGNGPLKRNPDVAIFRARIKAATGHQDAWTLTSTLTDLAFHTRGQAAHGLFDPPVPKGLVLFERLIEVHSRALEDDQEIHDRISGSFDGIPNLAKCNGLGFDIFRRPGLAKSKRALILVDPIVEVLAFFGLALLPVRGDGIRQDEARVRQKGFGIEVRRKDEFVWPAWGQPLDRWGIDALLDAWHQTWKPHKADDGLEWRMSRLDWDRLGVHAGWATRPYRPTASNDITKGFSSERIANSGDHRTRYGRSRDRRSSHFRH